MTAHLHGTYVEGCFRCELSADEVVYQADPATCLRVAREHLREANRLLLDGQPDAAGEELRTAMGWLPSWLEQEWDDRMAAWLEREGGPR